MRWHMGTGDAGIMPLLRDSRTDASGARQALLRHSPVATIHLDAIADNVHRLAAQAPRSGLIAVVKADGFGHGMVPVAQAALGSGATACGVTSLQEAYELRRAGVRGRIVSWLNPVGADFDWAIRADVDLAVPDREHLAAVIQAASTTRMRARVHLNVDVGMARDGASSGELNALFEHAALAEQARLIDVVGLMGHLPNAERGPAFNDDGIAQFDAASERARVAGLRPDRHLAATAAALTDPRTHRDAIRPGAGLVGIDPSGTVELSGAMTLTAPVVHTIDVAAGTPVGYGSTWRAPAGTSLALLPLGYADDIPREVRGASVLLAGRRRPIVGRVSMDQIVVDLGNDSVSLGEIATVFAPRGASLAPTVAEWAEWSGTIPHSIVTGIGPRIVRIYEENS